ncbi:MAG TPA: FmdB family zinc ribbon protein [Microthrixaceae bacterium]|nr:FmdB family zinc ribbon protein [Microthrixaceae bacterium]
MPTYDYRCRGCDHEFEIQQSFSDDPLTNCPECDGELRKVFSPVGISFKGSGFYKTDSRSGAGSKSTAGTNGSDSNGSSSNGSADTPSSSPKESKSESGSSGSSTPSTPSTSSSSTSAA